jgi:hypothetical protein
MKKIRKPGYLLINCQYCSNETRMEIVADYSQVENQMIGFHDDEWEIERGLVWYLLVCPACKNVSLQRAIWDEGEYTEEKIVYPTSDKAIEGLPPEVDIEYKKALKVQNIDSNAFAVLLGRVIDKVCADKGASGKNLIDRLESLANNNIIPQQLAIMAHQLRKLRNVGAHADLGDLTPAEVPILYELCRAILEYVYTAPELMQKVQAQLDKLKNKPNT